jgi:putative redox protein
VPEIRVSVSQQQDSTTSAAAIRGHRVLIDRPAAKGGGDAGPMGGELFLASVGGCFLSTLIAAARARELPASRWSVEVVGDLGGTPPRFQAIRLTVSGGGLDPAEFGKLVAIAERGCVVANTLAGTVDLRVAAGGTS